MHPAYDARPMGSGRRARAPRLLNRELSWLDFNARVLALAEDERVPLLERAKFAAIFATNLDEFFMVRVAGLQRQVAAGVTLRSPDGLRPAEQLEAVLDVAAGLAARHAVAWTDAIRPALARAGIRIVRWTDLDDPERAGLAGLFAERVFPVLTPLAVDPAHPFPFVSNRSLNLGVWLRDPTIGELRFARIKVPPILERFVPVGSVAGASSGLLPLEELIGGNLDRLFPGMEVTGHDAFRVTRDADLAIDDDDAEDLLRTVEDELRRRRVSPAVRLEVASGAAAQTVALLRRELGLAATSVHALPGPLGLGDLRELHRLTRPDLKDPPFSSVPAPALRPDLQGEVEIFERLDGGVILVHHPYETFAGSVQAFIEQAADDPQVLAIKQTLYRTTADPIVNALVRAAEAGKQVDVLVELKARFDEENNVAWARMLERAGCHVVYGVSGLKTHAKLVLVVRRVGDAVRRYVHVGTGNYNAATARVYEDLGLLSADPLLAREVGELFNLLSGFARRSGAERIIVAPFDLRERLLARISAEADAARAGHPARVVVKCNALTDPAIIEALYAASAAGVEVDAVVRGVCMMRPGVRRRSAPIRVRSILGRFLEHSRIYQFGVAPHTEAWIGSADLMERNLDRRVEVLVRIDDDGQRLRLAAILEHALRDPTAWTLGDDGTWARGADPGGRGLQAWLLDAVRPDDERSPEEPIVAAGGVVWRQTADGLQLAVVHRPRYDDWSFPKGKLGPGEDAIAGAVREVGEETGLRVRIGPALGATRYRKLTPTGSRPKVVHWWAMEAIDGAFTAGSEVDSLRWMAVREAERALSRPTDRELLARFVAVADRLAEARS
jgi:polyphosphate kinase